MTNPDSSLEQLLNFMTELIDQLFEEPFRDLNGFPKSLDCMKTGKAFTPASENKARVWCLRGKEEMW